MNGKEFHHSAAAQFRTVNPMGATHKSFFPKIAAAFLILITTVSCAEIARLAGLRTEAAIPTARVVREPVDVKSTLIDLIDALSTRSFPVVFEVDTEGDRLNLGVTARVTIMGTNMRDALSIPRQALHQEEGKPVVYVRNTEGFEPQEVKVKYLTESRAIIDGIDEGTEIALVNPEQQKDKGSAKTGPLAPILGGGAR